MTHHLDPAARTDSRPSIRTHLTAHPSQALAPDPVSGSIPPPLPSGRPPGPYDYVVASDPAIWPDSTGSTGPLLALPVVDRVAALAALSAGDRRLVVICDPAEYAAVAALAGQARGLYRSRIAVVPIGSGAAMQVAIALIGQVLLTSRLNRPVAEVIERLPALSRQLLHVVLLRSVARLDHPAVTVSHHMRSYLPGRRVFAVQSSPEPNLIWLNGQGVVRPANVGLVRPDHDPRLGIVVGVLGPREVPVGVLERAGLPTDAPSRLVTTMSPSRQWGDPEATEVVAMPQDLVGWVADQLPPVEAWPCHWCDEPLAAPVRTCPFCADTLPGPLTSTSPDRLSG